MPALEARDRRNAAVFYAATAVATLLWWGFLAAVPEARPRFFGTKFAEQFMLVFLAPDLIAALVLAAWLVRAVWRGDRLAPVVAWMHAGAQGYAFFLAVGLAAIDGRAYWGVVAMALSSGLALFFALRLSEVDILWGPFKFATDHERSSSRRWSASLAQTAVMWLVFLFALPLALACLEQRLGWEPHWFHFPGQIPLAATLFLVNGGLGLWSGRSMTQHGDGTPLPASCATRLVTSGLYSCIRNPMALTGILQGVSVGLAIGSSLVVLYAVLGGFAWDILVRPVEEDYLGSVFGSEYTAYRAAVPCWRLRLPKP